MSPVNILKKGFAIVYQDDKITTDGNKILQGNQIKVRLLDSEISAKVTLNKKIDGSEFNL